MHQYLKGKRFIGLLAAVLVLSLAVPYLIDSFKPGDKWSISDDGLLSYPKNRGAVEFTKTVLNDTPEFTLSKIIYASKGEKIYALLRVPKTNSAKMPAIILLPGALVAKEGEDERAAIFAKWGYVTLAIDERGNRGETQGGIVSMEDEYSRFSRNEEPIHHKMVFDVLRAFDFLAGQNYVDAENIAVFGESMGGRFGIMAGAIEPEIKAVIGVSTAGYDSLGKQFPDEGISRFFKSIDPDAYIGKISPRKLLMIHSTNDAVIPIDSARMTFGYAEEPKKFITVTCKTHGWCTDMEPILRAELAKILQK